MTDFTERRSEKRINRKAKELKIKSVDGAPELANREIQGNTVDISASGLQIVLDCNIPSGTTIEVWITPEDDKMRYHLAGMVRWSSEVKSDEFHIGILLLGREDIETDYLLWRDKFR